MTLNVEGMSWSKRGELTNYHVQLGMPDKCRAINEMFVCSK